MGGRLGDLGATDCERLADGFVAQPVNTATSLCYLVASIVVLAADRRVSGRWRPATVVFAASVAAIGVGSVLFHGPQPPGARVAHDLPIVVTGWIMARSALGRLVSRTGRRATVANRVVDALGVVAVVTSLLWIDLAMAWTVGYVAMVVLIEVLVVPALDPARRRGGFVLGSVPVLAAIAYAAGRTGSGVCDPDSVMQWHGVWHVLTAALFVLWWWLTAVAPDITRDTQRAGRASTRCR